MTAEATALIEDEIQIGRLVPFYSDAVTHLDAVQAASVYIEDGCVSIAGTELFGRPAIEQGMRETFSAFALLQLIAHGGLIETDGAAATARWSTVEFAIRREATDLNCIFGCYEDELVRLPHGWRFKKRTFTLAGRIQVETKKIQIISGFAPSLPFPL